MKCRLRATVAVAIVAVVAGHARPSLAVDPSRIENADKNPNDCLTYHGSYKSWHYSALDQINTSNVKNLQVAWMHSPGRVTRGLQSFPLVADGVLYYTGPYTGGSGPAAPRSSASTPRPAGPGGSSTPRAARLRRRRPGATNPTVSAAAAAGCRL